MQLMRYLMIVKMSEFLETSLKMQLMRYLMIVKMNEFLETSLKNATCVLDNAMSSSITV